MKTMLVVMADLFVVVTAIIAAYEFFCLKRYTTFTVPYTDKMISMNIIDADKRDPLLRKEKTDCYIGIVLATVCAANLSLFIAKWSGPIVFIAFFIGLMLMLHPDMEETPATRQGYFKVHHADMDIRKYHDFLVEQGDIGPDDPLQL